MDWERQIERQPKVGCGKRLGKILPIYCGNECGIYCDDCRAELQTRCGTDTGLN